MLATLLIPIVFDLKSNGTKGLVETIMASVLRVLVCIPSTKNLFLTFILTVIVMSRIKGELRSKITPIFYCGIH